MSLLLAATLPASLSAEDHTPGLRSEHGESNSVGAPDFILNELLSKYLNTYLEKYNGELSYQYLDQLRRLTEGGKTQRLELEKILKDINQLNDDFALGDKQDQAALNSKVAQLYQNQALLNSTADQRNAAYKSYKAYITANSEHIRSIPNIRAKMQSALSGIVKDLFTKTEAAVDAAKLVKAHQTEIESLNKHLNDYREEQNKLHETAETNARDRKKAFEDWKVTEGARLDGLRSASETEVAQNRVKEEAYKKERLEYERARRAFEKLGEDFLNLRNRLTYFSEAWVRFYIDCESRHNNAQSQLKNWKGAYGISNLIEESPGNYMWRVEYWYADQPFGKLSHSGSRDYRVPDNITQGWLENRRRQSELTQLENTLENTRRPIAPNQPLLVTTAQENFKAAQSSYDHSFGVHTAEVAGLEVLEKEVAQQVKRAIELEELNTQAAIDNLEANSGEKSLASENNLRKLNDELIEHYGKNYSDLYTIMSAFAEKGDVSETQRALNEALLRDPLNPAIMKISAILNQAGNINYTDATIAKSRSHIQALDGQVELLSEQNYDYQKQADSLRATLVAKRNLYDKLLAQLKEKFKQKTLENDSLSAKEANLKILQDQRKSLAHEDKTILELALMEKELGQELPLQQERIGSVNDVLAQLVRDDVLASTEAQTIQHDPGVIGKAGEKKWAPGTVSLGLGRHSDQDVIETKDLTGAAKMAMISDWYGVLNDHHAFDKQAALLGEGFSNRPGAKIDKFHRGIFLDTLYDKSNLQRITYRDESFSYRAVLDGESFLINERGGLEREDPTELGAFEYAFHTPAGTESGDLLRSVNHWLKSRFANQIKTLKGPDLDAIATSLSLLQEADKLPEGPEKLKLIEMAKGMGELVLRFSPAGEVVDLYEGISGYDLSGAKLSSAGRAMALVGVIIGDRKIWGAIMGPLTKRVAAIRNGFREGYQLEEAVHVVEEAEKITESAAMIERWGPMSKEPGPLHKILLQDGKNTVADTFRSGSYFEVVTKQEVKLYRVYGNDARELRYYWSRVKPTGPLQATIDLALDPAFKNSAAKWVEITVPANTRLFEGVASEVALHAGNTKAQVGQLLGGGQQVYMNQDIPRAWITSQGGF